MQLNIQELLKNEKTKKLVMLFLAGILVLIAATSLFPKEKKAANNQSALINETKRNDQKTTQALEKRLAALINGMEGIEDATVMVTMEKSSQLILADNRKEQEKNNSNDVLLVPQDSSAKAPVVVEELEPKVFGVVVTAKGVSDTATKLRVINAVRAVTGAGANRIEVCPAK